MVVVWPPVVLVTVDGPDSGQPVFGLLPKNWFGLSCAQPGAMSPVAPRPTSIWPWSSNTTRCWYSYQLIFEIDETASAVPWSAYSVPPPIWVSCAWVIRPVGSSWTQMPGIVRSTRLPLYVNDWSTSSASPWHTSGPCACRYCLPKPYEVMSLYWTWPVSYGTFSCAMLSWSRTRL